MNKMLDKEDFTMMKRAIFATQVFGPLSRGMAVPPRPQGRLCQVSSDPSGQF